MEDCTGVVGWWPLEILSLEVVLLEFSIEVYQYLTHSLVIQLLKLFKDLLGNQCCVGNLQWHHNQGYSTVHNDGTGNGIQQYIELGWGSPVAKTNGTTHKWYLWYFIFDFWEGSDEECQIGHGSRVDKAYLAWSRHNFVVNRQIWLFIYCLSVRDRQRCSFESIDTMRLCSCLQLAMQWLGCPLNNIDIISRYEAEYVQCILGRVLNGGVASRCG